MMEGAGSVSPLDELMDAASRAGCECFVWDQKQHGLVPYVPKNRTPECPFSIVDCEYCIRNQKLAQACDKPEIDTTQVEPNPAMALGLLGSWLAQAVGYDEPPVLNSTPNCESGIVNCPVCMKLPTVPAPELPKPPVFAVPELPELKLPEYTIPAVTFEPQFDWFSAQGKSLEQRGSVHYRQLTTLSARLSGLAAEAGLARTDPYPAAAISALICGLDLLRYDLSVLKAQL